MTKIQWLTFWTTLYNLPSAYYIKFTHDLTRNRNIYENVLHQH